MPIKSLKIEVDVASNQSISDNTINTDDFIPCGEDDTLLSKKIFYCAVTPHN